MSRDLDDTHGTLSLDIVLRYRLTIILTSMDGDAQFIDGWQERTGCPIILLSLTPAHNDVSTFVAGLEHALDGAPPADVQGGLSILDRVTELLNGLIAAPGDFCVVLRDYDVINAPGVHQTVSYIVEYLPPRMHMVIVTDDLPPLENLPRLLVRRHAVVLGKPVVRVVDSPTA